MNPFVRAHSAPPAPLTALGSALAFLVMAFPSTAEAATLISERASLQGNDRLNWSSLGRVFDPFAPDPNAFLSNSFTAVSQRGLDLQVDIPERPDLTPPFVFQTLPPPQGIPTNFASGDFLLFTGFTPGVFPSIGNSGPITLTFSEPVFGAGAQIAVDDALEPFTAFISAFDTAGNWIGFSRIGESSLVLDNSAVFLGIRSKTPNIAKVVFSTSVPERAFAINTLSIVTDVPEPMTTAGLWVVGAIATASILKHR